ncbi:MAG: class I SAM-dependent methyltransferase [Myxococcota bacterium]
MSLRLLISLSFALGCDAAETPANPADEPAAAKAPSKAAPPALGMPKPIPATKMEHFAKEGELQTTVLGEGDGPYRFTATWHLKQIPAWEKILAEVKGKPDLRYLEVGVYEGRSLLWMADNILTDPSGELVAVDIFADEYEANFDHNVAASPASARISKLKGPSADVLRDRTLEPFDVIYIDGSHTADDVLADAVLAWRLLKVGGLLIFDDYGWTGRKGIPLPPELLPRMAVDLFLAAYRYEVEAVHVGYQVAVRRVDNPCQPKDYCTPVGQYKYYWRDYELRAKDETVVPLSDAERGLVEAIAQSRPIGGFEHQVPPNIRESAAFKTLTERLALKL